MIRREEVCQYTRITASTKLPVKAGGGDAEGLGDRRRGEREGERRLGDRREEASVPTSSGGGAMVTPGRRRESDSRGASGSGSAFFGAQES